MPVAVAVPGLTAIEAPIRHILSKVARARQKECDRGFKIILVRSVSPVAATTAAPASAAGTWSESIAYTSGTTTACKSNDQVWTATLFREPVHKALAKAGSYSGRGISFSVASGSVVNVSVPSTYLTCTPSGAVNDHITIADVPIGANGSFTSKTSQEGVFNGSNAKFTYTFAGWFEGPTQAGTVTVPGMWSETVVPTSGATTMCASNDQSWTATLQS